MTKNNIVKLLEKEIEKELRYAYECGRVDYDMNKVINERCEDVLKRFYECDVKCKVFELFNDDEKIYVGCEGCNCVEKFSDEKLREFNDEIEKLNSGEKSIYMRENMCGLNVSFDCNYSIVDNVFVCYYWTE